MQKRKHPPINADNQVISNLKSKAIAEDGIMKFRDNEHFYEFLNLNNEELTALEKTFGYVSYDSRIEEVIDELDLVTTKSEFNLFKKKYQNYMTMRTWNGEESYERIIYPNCFTKIANKNGLYYVGDSAYRIIGEYMVNSDLKNVDQLMKVQYSELQKKSDKLTFNARKYITTNDINTTVLYENNNLKSTTTYIGGGPFGGEWATNPEGDRRVKVTIVAKTDVIYPIGTGYKYIINILARGQKKTWPFSGWRDYNTTVNVYGTIPGFDVIAYCEYWGTLNYEVDEHVSSGGLLNVDLFSSNYYTSGLGAPIYFKKVHIKANTRGTDTTYAYIDKEE